MTCPGQSEGVGSWDAELGATLGLPGSCGSGGTSVRHLGRDSPQASLQVVWAWLGDLCRFSTLRLPALAPK